MKNVLKNVIFVTLLAFVISCKKAPAEQKKMDCTDVDWAYKGEAKPENWVNLCTGFTDCGGEEQSPINIEIAKAKKSEDLPKLQFEYGNTPVSIVNNGHTIQFNIAGEHSLQIGDKNYKLLQFHYHAASEHTVDGEHYPMEVHFVHKGDEGLAVVGMLFQEGQSSLLLDNYLSFFPKQKGEYEIEKTIPMSALVPQEVSYYHYDGSLTTPPCSEIVDWYVLQKPIEASKRQLEQMTALLHNNYRPVQKLNGREVLRN